MEQRGARATVIGGSISGLVAARVLADHFEHVTVIDRDDLPDTPTFRKGAPQSRHLHVLLGRGHDILESFFPGLTDDLVSMGVPVREWGWHTRTMVSNGKWLPKFHSGHKMVSASRTLLEWTIRDRLKRNPRVRFASGTTVAGLRVSADGATIIGVTLQDGETLDADFVVDASGRTSKAAEWLAGLGFGTVEESTVNSYLGYATRWYEIPADFRQEWEALVIQSVPPHLPRGGGIFPAEGNRWMVTLSGANKDYPPTDEEGFLAFARSLQTPELYEAIKDATPLSPVYGYQRTAGVWRHYERMARWPERFVVMGDAACAFNPIYGQGMTAAAMGAAELQQLFATQPVNGLARRFQLAAARALQTPWMMSTGEDFRYPLTEGKRPVGINRGMHWYTDQLFDIMPESTAASQAFIEVMQLLSPPTVLFRPAILFLVLRHTLRGRRRMPTAFSEQLGHGRV
jgi:2-polyprenyl-6-methoxyphenol hydroxylase-like FAD-dependent oxidoreductase